MFVLINKCSWSISKYRNKYNQNYPLLLLLAISRKRWTLIFRKYPTTRSSHGTCSVRKGVFRNFIKFTGKDLYQSLFFNKVAGHKLATLLKGNFGTDVFLWILRNFKDHFFHRTPLVAASKRPIFTQVTKHL